MFKPFSAWDEPALSSLSFLITYEGKSPYDIIDKALRPFTNTLSVIRIQDEPGKITIVFNKMTWPIERKIAINRIGLPPEYKIYYLEKKDVQRPDA